MSSNCLEKQSVLYGRHSMDIANDNRKIEGNDHIWCSEDFNEKSLIIELDTYLGNSKCVINYW